MKQSDIVEKTTPYWWEAAPVAPIPDHPLPEKLDVAIIGAGYAGLSAGLVLARAGRSVACLDRMNPGEGASSRNGGITSGNLRPTRTELVRKFGPERADAIDKEGRTARDFVYEMIRAEGMDCDFQLTGRFTAAFGRDQYDRMARDAEALAKRVGVEAYAVPHAEQHDYIGTDFYRGGVVQMDIGGLHPAKFHREMLRIAGEAGVDVRSGCHVERVEPEGDGFLVHTSRGVIRAGKVLVCTNGYTDAADSWLRRRLVPVRSRIIVTEELPDEVMARLMPRNMMMGEGRILGFYYRPTPDRKRILLGGRDGSLHGEPIAPILHLRDGLTELFPELEGVRLTHTWYGNVAMNRDMLPRIFERNGIHYATGFCGSGVIWATWLGNRIAHKLLGDGKKGRSAFDFQPPALVPFYNGTPWFMPVLMRYYRFQDRFAMHRADR